MTDSDDEVKCPVCRTHTDADSLASQQVVMLGMKAIFEGDDQMVSDVFEQMTPFDGHVAISLCARLLDDFSELTGQPVMPMIEYYRKQLSAAQTETAAE